MSYFLTRGLKCSKKIWLLPCLLASYSTSFALNDSHTDIYATVVPVKQAQISSEITARVEHVNIKDGESFKKGQTLMSFDCRLIKIDLGKYQAKENADMAKLQSAKKLAELDSISHVEFAVAQSDWEQTRAEVQMLKYKEDHCTIKAPYSGVVMHRFINENELVKVGDPLLKILSNDQLEVKMYVESEHLPHLSIGSHFKLSLKELPKQRLSGEVTRIVHSIDPASQSLLIYGQLNGKDLPIFSGMSGEVAFDSMKSKRVAIKHD